MAVTTPARTLLTSADDWTRDLLLDAHNNTHPTGGLLAGWAQVMQSAEDAWRATRPPDSAGSPFEHATITAARLVEQADQPRAAVEARTGRVAVLLDELADAIPAQRSTPGPTRLDDAALRTGILHVGYVLTHAVATRIAHHTGPEPTPETETTWQSLQRVRGIEQLLDAHLHGQRRPQPAATQVAEVTGALHGWLQVAYRAPEPPDPMTRLILADTARSVLINTARLAVHGAQSSQLDTRDVRERLLPAIREAVQGWEDSRTLWAAMITPAARQLPDVVAAATRLQQALRQPEMTRHLAAHEATIASALVATCEVALINERALAHPQLTAPASTIAKLTTEAYEKDPHNQSWFQIWNSINHLEGTKPTQLPEIVRTDLATRARSTLNATLAARSAGHVLTQPTRLSPCITLHIARETTPPSRGAPRVSSSRTNPRPTGIAP